MKFIKTAYGYVRQDLIEAVYMGSNSDEFKCNIFLQVNGCPHLIATFVKLKNENINLQENGRKFIDEFIDQLNSDAMKDLLLP